MQWLSRKEFDAQISLMLLELNKLRGIVVDDRFPDVRRLTSAFAPRIFELMCLVVDDMVAAKGHHPELGKMLPYLMSCIHRPIEESASVPPYLKNECLDYAIDAVAGELNDRLELADLSTEDLWDLVGYDERPQGIWIVLEGMMKPVSAAMGDETSTF